MVVKDRTLVTLQCTLLLSLFIQVPLVNTTGNNNVTSFDLRDCFPIPQYFEKFQSFFNCSVISPSIERVECAEGSGVNIWLNSKEADTEISCLSRLNIQANAVFAYMTTGSDLFGGTYIHRQRYSQNASDPFNSIIGVRMFPPYPHNSRYFISHPAFPEDVVSIMIFYTFWEQGGFWMGNYYGEVMDIEARNERVLIPCILDGSQIPNSTLFYIVEPASSTKNETLIPLKADNVAISYSSPDGHYFNTSALENYDSTLYRCLPDIQNNLEWDFRIIDLPEFKATPQMPADNEPIRLFVMKEQPQTSITLECISKSPIRMVMEGLMIPKCEEDQKDEECLEPPLYETKHLPKLRYVATQIIPMWLYYDRLEAKCITEGKEYNWEVVVEDADVSPHLSFEYATNRKQSLDDFEFYCSSMVYEDVRLRAIKCSNIHQCKLLEECFGKEYKCSDIATPGSDCSRSPISVFQSCQRSKALSPGEITLCEAGGFQFKQIHFLGFDGFIHNFDETIKLQARAVIRMRFDDQIVFYTKKSYEFTCEVHQFISEGEIHFFTTSTTQIIQRSSVQRANETTPYSETFTVEMVEAENFAINCRAPVLYSSFQWVISPAIFLEVRESIPPKILTEITSRSFEDGALDISIECKVEGEPTPNITWTRLEVKEDDEPLQPVLVGNDTLILKFEIFNKDLVGIYTCTTANIAGSDSKNFELLEKKDKTWIIISASGGAGIILILVGLTAFIYYYRKLNKPLAQLDEEEVNEFLYGSLTEESDLDNETENDKCSHLPFNKEFEIKKEDIEYIDKQMRLGKGEFGEVFLGKLVKMGNPVAFKMTKLNCPPIVFRALLKELKIMTYVPEHDNIVHLVGAYIEEIKNGILYIVTEFCENGSLEKYLEKNRECYTNINLTVETSGKVSQYQAIASFSTLNFQDLVRWSAEIAAGMEFLSTMKIVHLDLSARNILLNASRTAKISDFGLSRRLYEKINYVKVGEEPLPWRWLAIECLQTNTFSTQSDIWAYGILLYEIFSLGNEPYPGISWSTEFGNQLKFGLRNQKPVHASDEIYELMKNCWNEDPDQRPSFSSLSEYFQKLVEPIPAKPAEKADVERTRQYISLDLLGKSIPEDARGRLYVTQL